MHPSSWRSTPIADELIERILYLEVHHPNVERLGNIRTGETASEKLSLASEVETEAIGRLNRGIAACAAIGDNGTRELLRRSSSVRNGTPTGWRLGALAPSPRRRTFPQPGPSGVMSS
jgi:bacterioferritin (cytochrome b1)